jgi:undecaprenyl pyrophosphate synthase
MPIVCGGDWNLIMENIDKKGVDTVREIVKHCGVIGVQTLTLFFRHYCHARG